MLHIYVEFTSHRQSSHYFLLNCIPSTAIHTIILVFIGLYTNIYNLLNALQNPTSINYTHYSLHPVVLLSYPLITANQY